MTHAKGNKQREIEIVCKWKRSIETATCEILNNPLVDDPVVVSELAKWLERERAAVKAEEARIEADYR
jgi:hypothetical protein